MEKRLALAVALIGLAGCGAAGQEFVGVWTLSSGTTVVTCGALGGSSADQGTFAVTQSGATLTSNPSSSDCKLQWTVSTDNSATLVANQSCTFTQNGVTAIITFSSGSATLLDSNDLTVTATGSGPTTAGGISTTCDATYSITATKDAN
jgi:hypothetical protein